MAPPDTVSAAARARTLVIDRARALLATGDTAAAAAALRDAAAAAPNDGTLWHEYGMLLSAWTRPYWRKGSMPNGVPQRIIAAESSLARATRLAPDSVWYAIDYANQLWGSNFTSLTMAKGVQERALRVASANGDTASEARLSDAVGMLLWRRYEPVANRRYEIMNLGYTPREFFDQPDRFRDYIDGATKKWDPPLGVALHVEALRYFRRARDLHSDDESPLRHEAMALAEGGRWAELSQVAAEHTRRRPGHAWGWLALGLAEHRRGLMAPATAAFDSGFARLPPDERARLESLRRLMPTSREGHFDSLPPARREAETALYWDLANPTLLLGGNPVQNEFRARVVHAELLWTNEEYRLKGADTDRGEIFIRWGPPDDISTLDQYTLVWMYRRVGLHFVFNQPPTLGVAYLQPGHRSYMLEPNRARRPALWENVPLLRRGLDTMALQVARFRGSADSIDVAVYAGIRAGALRAGLPTDTSLVKTGVFAVDGAGRTLSRVTGVLRTGETDTLAWNDQRWRLRTSARAAYLRVEALDPDAERVARGLQMLDGFPLSGFGSSDVLLGTRVTAPAAIDRARWSEFTIEPLRGNGVRRGQPIDLLWEVYEPAPIDGTARYRVSIVVQRIERGGLVGVSARVVGTVRDAVMRNSGNDRIAVEYDRVVPASPVRTESLRLDLGSARSGRYLLTVTMRDLNSDRTVSRQREVAID